MMLPAEIGLKDIKGRYILPMIHTTPAVVWMSWQKLSSKRVSSLHKKISPIMEKITILSDINIPHIPPLGPVPIPEIIGPSVALVDGDTRRFQGLGSQLLIFVADQMGRRREPWSGDFRRCVFYGLEKRCFFFGEASYYPIASMYGIFTNIYHKNQPNVGEYAIHGCYGYGNWFNNPFEKGVKMGI